MSEYGRGRIPVGVAVNTRKQNTARQTASDPVGIPVIKYGMLVLVGLVIIKKFVK